MTQTVRVITVTGEVMHDESITIAMLRKHEDNFEKIMQAISTGGVFTYQDDDGLLRIYCLDPEGGIHDEIFVVVDISKSESWTQGSVWHPVVGTVVYDSFTAAEEQRKDYIERTDASANTVKIYKLLPVQRD